MCFRGTDWCCENHRKLLVKQRTPGCGHEVNVCPGLVPHDKCCGPCHDIAVSVASNGSSGDDAANTR